ncbi:EFR1 family ferrodoxin [Vallitalea okinawensis]|uniref:EFR1 family ferrodoxin n=1 Tax=Vallitalea okinawensis TaxID=2078660 RepID=UPI000CFB7F15|nr:EFR1 family ferrodoxin [Vallitalea okinawensis]
MKILVLYFSGTGNTEYIARYIQKRFNNERHEVTCTPIEKMDKDTISAYDILGFGFPVFACDIPGFVKEYLVDLPLVKTQSVFIFCTKGFFSGTAINSAFDFFKGIGYRPIGYADIAMPGSDGLAFMKPDSKKVQGYIDRDYSYIPEVDRMTMSIEKKIDSKDQLLVNSGVNLITKKGQSLLSNALKVGLGTAEGWLKKKFWADESCIRCKKCEKICPRNNIKVDDRGVHFSDQCVVCMRCLHQCPKESIQIGKNTIGKVRWKGPLGDYKPL